MSYFTDFYEGEEGFYNGMVFKLEDIGDDVVYTKEEAYKLTIFYSNGKTYEVKDVFDIAVIKHKGGGYDVEYSYDYKSKEDKPFGYEHEDGTKTVKTNTHDVIKIFMMSRKVDGVREGRLVEFGK